MNIFLFLPVEKENYASVSYISLDKSHLDIYLTCQKKPIYLYYLPSWLKSK